MDSHYATLAVLEHSNNCLERIKRSREPKRKLRNKDTINIIKFDT